MQLQPGWLSQPLLGARRRRRRRRASPAFQQWPKLPDFSRSGERISSFTCLVLLGFEFLLASAAAGINLVRRWEGGASSAEDLVSRASVLIP